MALKALCEGCVSAYMLQRGWKLEAEQKFLFGSGSFASAAMPALAPALFMISRLDPGPFHISARESSCSGWYMCSQSAFTLWIEPRVSLFPKCSVLVTSQNHSPQCLEERTSYGLADS